MAVGTDNPWPESFDRLIERWERIARVKSVRLDATKPPVVPPFRAAFIGKPGRGQDPALAELKRVIGETRDQPAEGQDPLADIEIEGALLGQLARHTDYLGDWSQTTSYERADKEKWFAFRLGFWTGLHSLVVVDVDRSLELLSASNEVVGEPEKEAEVRWQTGIETLRAIVREPWIEPAVLLVGDRDLEKVLDENLDLKEEFGPGVVRFSPLGTSEAQEVAERLLRGHGFKLSEASKKKLNDGLLRLPGEANYRSVSKLAVEIGANQAARIRAPLRKGKPVGTLFDIEPEDIPLNDGLVTKQEVLDKFDELIGLEEIKEELKRLVDLAEARQRRRQEGARVSAANRNYHFIFRGPPGTGKTTVARLMGDLFFTAGLLPKGHLIERDRAGLVGRYLGHSEINLAEAVDEAQGGVLFIDEAYALGGKETEDGRSDQYGQAIVDALVQRLYESPGSFSCVIAGYGDEMREFLEINDGLSSRFNHELVFPSFSAAELVSVTMDRAGQSGLGVVAEEKASEELEPLMQELIETADPETFGNARTAIEIADRAVESALLKDRDRVQAEDFSEAIEHAIGVALARQKSEASGAPIKGPASEETIEKALSCLANFETTPEADRQSLELLIRSFRNDEPRVGFVNGLPRGIADLAFCSSDLPEDSKLEMAEAIVSLYKEVGLLRSTDVKIFDPGVGGGRHGSEVLDELFETASSSGALLIPDLVQMVEALGGETPGERELLLTALIDLIHRNRNDLAVFLGAPVVGTFQDPLLDRLLGEFEYSL